MGERDGERLLEGAYDLMSPEDNRTYYRDFADRYDSDFAEELGYSLAATVAAICRDLSGPLDVPVADIGCGTGLVGAALGGEVDGTDISPEMLEVAARKGVYRQLFEGDLSARLDVADGAYRSVVSAGTFTTGHVGPDALNEVLRVLAPGGCGAISVNARHWQSAGFADAFAALRPRLGRFERTEVSIYGPRNTGPHAADRGLVVLFEKA